jgi:hypothetical protein
MNLPTHKNMKAKFDHLLDELSVVDWLFFHYSGYSASTKEYNFSININIS